MFLILCPLPIELKCFLNSLQKQGFTYSTKQIRELTVYECSELGWLIACGGHGKTQFAIHTQFLIDHITNVKAVLCVGGAGALSSETSIGTIVVGTKTIEHDFNLLFIKRPSPEFCADPTLLQHLKDVAQDIPHVQFAPIASGDEDVISHERRKQLLTQTAALAVAWEGSGGGRACAFNKRPYIEVRIITDNSNEDATHDFRKNIETGINTICTFLLKANLK